MSNPNLSFDFAIGARIRQRRLTLQMSQAELGKRLGVTFQQVQNYERGANRISGETLLRACAALGISTSALIEGLQTPGESDLADHARRLEDIELLQALQRIQSPQLRAAIVELVRLAAGD